MIDFGVLLEYASVTLSFFEQFTNPVILSYCWASDITGVDLLHPTTKSYFVCFDTVERQILNDLRVRSLMWKHEIATEFAKKSKNLPNSESLDVVSVSRGTFYSTLT